MYWDSWSQLDALANNVCFFKLMVKLKSWYMLLRSSPWGFAAISLSGLQNQQQHQQKYPFLSWRLHMPLSLLSDDLGLTQPFQSYVNSKQGVGKYTALFYFTINVESLIGRAVKLQFWITESCWGALVGSQSICSHVWLSMGVQSLSLSHVWVHPQGSGDFRNESLPSPRSWKAASQGWRDDLCPEFLVLRHQIDAFRSFSCQLEKFHYVKARNWS